MTWLPDSVAECGRAPASHVTKIVGAFTKFAPLIVTVCGLVEPVTGFGLTLLIVGAGLAPLVTVTLVPPDCGPSPPVCMLKPFCTTKL